jgi:hypothetical protein
LLPDEAAVMPIKNIHRLPLTDHPLRWGRQEEGDGTIAPSERNHPRYS